MAQAIVRVADLREQVYDTLRERIASGELPADSKFYEIALAKELGVSRTPVREALALLARDGLLVQMARGFRFPRFTPREIMEIIEIRLLLEPYAIERMVAGGPRKAMQELGRRVRRDLFAVGHETAQAYADAHRKIRTDIYGHVGNRQLAEAIVRYEDSVNYIRIRTLDDAGLRRISYEGMLKLADAIEACDADAARAAMEQQLLNARQAFLAHAEDGCADEA